jgi:hypothetical protein
MDRKAQEIIKSMYGNLHRYATHMMNTALHESSEGGGADGRGWEGSGNIVAITVLSLPITPIGLEEKWQP